MAREKKKSNGKYVIICITLIILEAILYFYLDNQYKLKEKKLETIHQKYIEEKKKLKINKETLKDYGDIPNKIENEKKEYFNSIKLLEDKILAGESKAKIAYLTFDDGPYYNTYKVLDILDKYDVKATFFTISINGEYCHDKKNENCYKLYNEYIRRGHTIANHTYTHGIKTGLYSSTEAFMDAVRRQEELIKEQTGGYETKILRFPGGSSTAKNLKEPIIEQLRSKGYGWVDWTAQDGDGKGGRTTEEMWNMFTSSINSNIEVVLLHDYNQTTTNLLPSIIEYLQKNDYILLPLFYESNMIKK